MFDISKITQNQLALMKNRPTLCTNLKKGSSGNIQKAQQHQRFRSNYNLVKLHQDDLFEKKHSNSGATEVLF
jgi:hypothetical protein